MSDEEKKVETPPAKPRKWLRRLRIALSVLFGVLTVALVVLWVRSYFTRDYLYWNIRGHRSILVGVADGQVIVHTDTFTMGRSRFRWMPWERVSQIFRWQPLPTSFARRMEFGFQLVIPCLFVLAIPGVGVALIWPWYSPRFSLRTLLIATTLVAVVLGLGVWLAS